MRLPSDGRDILRDLDTRQYNIDTPDALLLAGAVPGSAQEGQIARVSRDGALLVDRIQERRKLAWEPWDLRVRTSLDEMGQDTCFRFVAKGTTMYYSEGYWCDGFDELTVWVTPGMHNSGANKSPYFEFRLYPYSEFDAFGAISIWSKTWTNLASGANPLAAAFNIRTPQFATGGEVRCVSPLMFDFCFRADASDASLLIPFTVRVTGVRQ